MQSASFLVAARAAALHRDGPQAQRHGEGQERERSVRVTELRFCLGEMSHPDAYYSGKRDERRQGCDSPMKNLTGLTGGVF